MSRKLPEMLSSAFADFAGRWNEQLLAHKNGEPPKFREMVAGVRSLQKAISRGDDAVDPKLREARDAPVHVVTRIEHLAEAIEERWRVEVEDPSLSGTATEEEIEFLKRLTFKSKRPTPLYYYRELQNLRDPLHFRPRS